MRIAFFHNLPSGGAKRSAHELVKRMTKNHVVDLYLYDSDAESFLDLRQFVHQTALVPGGETRQAHGVGALTSLIHLRRVSVEVARRINEGHYDLAFIMQCKVFNSPFVLRYLRIPSVYFCHEPAAKNLEPHFHIERLAPHKRAFMNWMARIDSINARCATIILANSLYSRESIYRAYGVYPRLNYLGVDTTHFRPLNLERERTILSVGTLNFPLKAQDFIIESVATLKERPSIRFIYNYDSGHFQAQLIQLAERRAVSVFFERLATEDSLAISYNRATLTVFPSRLEPLGLVPLESLACATPVVGVAEAGVRETVQHNETGLLTERDPYEFGEAIDRLLKDRALCLKMGELGRERVLAHWTWEQSYQQLEKNIEYALKNKTVD